MVKHESALLAIAALFFLLFFQPVAALDPVPAFSVALSGADLSPDPAIPAAFIGTVLTGKSTTVSIMMDLLASQPAPSPETFTLDLQSLPKISGISFSAIVGGVEQDSCTTTQSCTIDLHIKTDKADIFHSLDPDPPDAQPGSYPLSIIIRRGGVSQTVPLTLKIVSGEIFAVFRDQNGKFIGKDPFVMKQGENESVSVVSFGFPRDDLLPATTAISVRAEPPFAVGEGTLSLIKQSCSKQELQNYGDCLSTLEIATARTTFAGERTIIVSAGQSDVNGFILRVEEGGIYIGYFASFFFDTDGKAKAYCRATVDKTVAAPGTENNEPLFDFLYGDEGKTSIRSVKGKRTQSTSGTSEFKADIDLPSLVFKDAADFGRCVVRWTAGKTFEATDIDSIPFKPALSFKKEGGGKLSCMGTETTAFSENVVLRPFSTSNRWTEVEFLDKDSLAFVRDGKQVTLKKAKKQSGSVAVHMAAEEAGVSAGTVVTCRMTESYYPLQQMGGPKPAQAPLRIIASRQTTLDQSCETLQETGFGGSKTIRFIGVGTDKTAYDAARNQVIKAFKTHPIFGTATGTFTLLNVVHPYPTAPSDVDDVLQKAAAYQKYCPADFSLYIGVPPAGASNSRSYTRFSEQFMVLYETPSDLQPVFLHEAGHLFGNLDDEYIDLNSASHTSPFSNCRPTSQMISDGRAVCQEWKDYPIYASCIPGCREDGRYRSTENSIMNHHEADQRFSVVQCAWLAENLEKLRNHAHKIDFARGMKQCIENIEKNGNSYNLVWEAAAPA